MTVDEPREFVHVALPAADRAGVALVTLDRREALNALSYELITELDAALAALDADPDCRAIVITGAGERAFAAGADVRQLAAETTSSLRGSDPFSAIDRVARLSTPTIAAVRGFALGGGCELARAAWRSPADADTAPRACGERSSCRGNDRHGLRSQLHRSRGFCRSCRMGQEPVGARQQCLSRRAME